MCKAGFEGDADGCYACALGAYKNYDGAGRCETCKENANTTGTNSTDSTDCCKWFHFMRDTRTDMVRLYWAENESDVASRWVHSESNSCSYCAATKIKEKSLSFAFSVNQPEYLSLSDPKSGLPYPPFNTSVFEFARFFFWIKKSKSSTQLQT